MRFYAQLSRS